VRREQPLEQQQQAAVSALLLVAVLTGKNMRRLKTLDTTRICFIPLRKQSCQQITQFYKL
jgi:hypothetical protein